MWTIPTQNGFFPFRLTTRELPSVLTLPIISSWIERTDNWQCQLSVRKIAILQKIVRYYRILQSFVRFFKSSGLCEDSNFHHQLSLRILLCQSYSINIKVDSGQNLWHSVFYGVLFLLICG